MLCIRMAQALHVQLLANKQRALLPVVHGSGAVAPYHCIDTMDARSDMLHQLRHVAHVLAQLRDDRVPARSALCRDMPLLEYRAQLHHRRSVGRHRSLKRR